MEYDNYERYVDHNIGKWYSIINACIIGAYTGCVVDILYTTINEIKTCKRDLLRLYHKLPDDDYETKNKVMDLIKTVCDAYAFYYNSNSTLCRIVQNILQK